MKHTKKTALRLILPFLLSGLASCTKVPTSAPSVSSPAGEDYDSVSLDAPLRNVYSIGETIDFSDCYIVLNKDGQVVERVSFLDSRVRISGADTETEGSKAITITFGSYTNQIPYRVVTHYVTFDFNGGSYNGKTEPLVLPLYNNYIDISEIRPQKETEDFFDSTQLIFSGWFYDAELNNRATYQLDEEFFCESSVTLYASYETDYSDRFVYSIDQESNSATLLSLNFSGSYNFWWLDELTIPSSIHGYPVKKIGSFFVGESDYAFLLSITKVYFAPDSSVEVIDHDAFNGLRSLVSVEFPSSLKKIGDRAFYQAQLAAIHFTENIEELGAEAFAYDTNLKSLSFEEDNSIRIIGEGCFKYCSGLKRVDLPEGLTEIRDGAFERCEEITSLSLPSSLTLIGAGTFKQMGSLSSIDVNENNPNFTSIDGNLYSKDKKKLIRFCFGNDASSFELPSSVQIIGDSAFNVYAEFTNLLSVKLNEGITYIEKDAFGGCKFDFTLPKSLISFALGAFSGYSGTAINVNPENDKYAAKDGILCSKDFKTLYAYPINTEIVDFVLDSRIETISEFAFNDIQSRKSFTIPEDASLKEIRRNGLRFTTFQNLAVLDIHRKTRPICQLDSFFDASESSYSKNFDRILCISDDQVRTQFESVLANKKQTFAIYSPSELIPDIDANLAKLGFTDFAYFQTYSEAYNFFKIGFLGNKSLWNKLYLVYKDNLATSQQIAYYSIVEQYVCLSYYQEFSEKGSDNYLALSYFYSLKYRYEMAPEEISSKTLPRLEKISSSFAISNASRILNSLYNEILSFPLDSNTFDAAAYKTLEKKINDEFLEQRSLPNKVYSKIILRKVSNRINTVLSVTDYTHENVNRIYERLYPGYSTSQMGLIEYLDYACNDYDKQNVVYHYAEFETFLLGFDNGVDGIVQQDYNKRKEELRNFTFDSTDREGDVAFFNSVCNTLYSRFYYHLVADKETDYFDYIAAIKTIEVDLNIQAFLDGYQELTPETFASSLDFINAIDASLPLAGDTSLLVGYQAYLKKSDIVREYADNHAAKVKAEIDRFALTDENLSSDSIRKLYHDYHCFGSYAAEFLKDDTKDYVEEYNICLSSYFIHYLFKRASESPEGSDASIALKKIYYGCYDLSTLEHRDGVKNYIEESRSHISPENFERIYHYDEYLDFETNLN